MRRKIVAAGMALLCTFSIITGITADAKTSGVHQTKLEEYVMSEMQDAHVPGMAISIVNDSRELYCAAYGTVDKTEADFTLGALSQSITATAIMHLKEADELKLDDTVSDYLTGYDEIADVTIQDLLQHTSGISEKSTCTDIEQSGKWGEYSYADVNYVLLGKIIEEISDLSYEEYVSDNIFDPLKMESTYSINHSQELSGDIVKGYQTYFGFHFPKDNSYQKDDKKLDAASGYMMSNVKDMGRFLQMYLDDGGKVLDKKSIKKMLQGDVSMKENSLAKDTMFGGNASYGMGWIEKEVNGTPLLYQIGKVPNATTAVVILPKENLGITMMFNSMDYLVGQKLIEKMEEGIISIVLGTQAEDIGSSAYLTNYAIVNGLMVLAIILAWMPMIMMGFWSNRRRNHVWSVAGICIDALIHLVVPTVVIILLFTVAPLELLQNFIPDVYIAVWVFVASLYLGALVKLIAMLVYTFKAPKADEIQEEENNEKKEDESDKIEDSPEKTEDKPDKTEDSPEKTEDEPDKTEDSPEKTEDEPDKTEDSPEETEDEPDKTKDSPEEKKADTEKEK